MKNELKENLLELLWERRIEAEIENIAISSSGDCIIESSSGHIYCFDKEGDVSWEYETKEMDKKFDILMRSNEDDILGGFYHLKYDHIVNILSNSGELIFENEFPYYVLEHKPFDISLSNGRAVVSKDDKILFFDKKNKLGEYIADSKTFVRISSSGEYIVAASEKGTIYFFNKNGRLLWEHNLENDIFQIHLSFDGKYLGVCCGKEKDELYFFDNEGKLLWDYKNKLTNIRIVGISPSGQCVISGLKVIVPEHDEIVNIKGREYVVHVKNHYTVQICYFNKNGLQWKLEDDKYILTDAWVEISPDFEYIGLTATVCQGPSSPSYEIWFMDKDGKILWKSSEIGFGAWIKSITKKGEIIAVLDENVWYLFNKNGKLLLKDYFLIYLDPDIFPSREEYTDIRISTNGKYLAAQYGNVIQLFRVKI